MSKIKKEEYTFIFSIVVYRNYEDVIELLASIREKIKESYKIIIVNNYYDENSKKEIERISKENNCIFINSENKGYGYGNNLAIDYALESYNFNYIIISNPDIVIKKFEKIDLNENSDIIAPQIRTLNNKNQNPMCPFDIFFIRKIIYNGFKKNNKFFIYIGIILNRIIREVTIYLWKFFRKNRKIIYMAHGSFLLINKKCLEKLKKTNNFPLYDKKIFLFGEEMDLAIKLKKANMITIYTDSISVLHKEDGSMKYRNDINKELKKSNIYIYEKYYNIHNIKRKN